MTIETGPEVFSDLCASESGQGATEYILLLVVVVAVTLLFRGRITDAIRLKLEEIVHAMEQFNIESS